MKTRNYKDYTIVNQFTSNSYGFNHISSLLHNGLLICEHKVHYINRTWEAYTYRTSMQAVLSDCINNIESLFLYNFKCKNGIKRLTAYKRTIALNECYRSNFHDINTLNEFYKSL